MRHRCLAVAVALACGVPSYGLGHAQPKASYLFVQRADEATIKATSTDRKTYQITMSGVGPETVFFTDQPQRKAGMIDQKAFMAVFAREESKRVQPNAALVWSAPEHGALIVKLTGGSYNASDGTLVYEATILPAAEGGLAAFDRRKAIGSVPERVTRPTLFIDGFDLGCNWGDTSNC
jgi:hypothetical protein